MCSLYIFAYLISDAGEPNLSYHACRFVVYISTFAKPIGLYLTLLFSIERLCTKVLSSFIVYFANYHKLLRKLYLVSIILCAAFVFSIRLYEVLNLITPSQYNETKTVDNPNEQVDDIEDVKGKEKNSKDRSIRFPYCFNTMDVDKYAVFLSFYTIQYWFEYLAFSLIILILLIILLQQCILPRIQQRNAMRPFSVNTKFYLSLSFCVVLSESILLFFHYIVDDPNNSNTIVDTTSLEIFLFIYNFRCIILSLVICLTTCDPLKSFIYEIFIARSYLDNFDESDRSESLNNQSEQYSSKKRTNHGTHNKFRNKFTRNKTKGDREYLENEEPQMD